MRGSTTCSRYLEYATKKLTHIIRECKSTSDSEEDEDDLESRYLREVKKYNSDPSVSKLDPSEQVDGYWAKIDSQSYPILTKVAKALLSAFHGPLVEGSFSEMGELIDEKSGRLDVETYAALQTVRSTLAAKEVSAIDYFKKSKPIHQPVDKLLVQNMQTAWKKNDVRKSTTRTQNEKRKTELGATNKKATPKRTAKEVMMNEAKKAKEGQSLVEAATVTQNEQGKTELGANNKKASPKRTAREVMMEAATVAVAES